MKKTIEFSAKLNTQEFDAQVTRLQQRLKQSQSDMSSKVLSSEVQQKMSRAGISTGQNPQQAEQQQRSSLREMDRFIKEQYRQAAQLNKAIDDRTKQMEKLRKMEKDALDDEKKKLEIAQKLKEVESQKQSLERQHQQQMGNLNTSLNQRQSMSGGAGAPEGWDRLATAYSRGGVGGAARAGYRMAGGAWGVGLGALGVAGAALQYMDPVARSMAADKRNYTYAQGSITGGLGHTGDIYGNKLASTMYYAPERQKALSTALEKMQRTQTLDNLSPWGGLLGTAAAGAAGGRMIGAGIGAVGGAIGGMGVASVPAAIAGSAAGATTGTLVGGGLGLLKGAYDIAGDPRRRNAFLAQMGSETARKNLEGMQYSEMMSDFNSLTEAEKQKDPVKRMAEERYQATRERNLSVQRAMGISNSEFYGGGGLLSRGFRGGFAEEDTLGMANDISGAGGSTMSARYNNVFGNQLAKRMDLTNAGQVMGGISRQLGGNVETEAATIKVMSEAMKIGLDKSEFAAEQRKFAELTVGAIQQSGASSVAGAASAAASFTAFNAGKTMADLGGMGEAKGFFDSATSQTGNPRGAIFASKIMSDPGLRGLSFDTQKVLSETPEGRLTEDHPAVQQAVAEINAKLPQDQQVSAGDVVKKLKGVKGDSVIIRGGVEGQRKALQNKYSELKAKGMSEDEINTELQAMPEFNKMLTGIGTEDSGFNQMSNQGMRSFGMKLVKGEVGASEYDDAIRGKAAGTGSTGRVEDQSMEAVARQQEIVNNNFMTMKDAMGQAAETAKQMTEQALNMHMRLAEAIEKGKSLTPEEFRKIVLPDVKPSSTGAKK